MQKRIHQTSAAWRLSLRVFMLLTLPVWLGACAPSLQRFEYAHRQMGTMFRVVLYARNEQAAKQASDAAFARVDELNRVLSDYFRRSELNQLSDTAGSGKTMRLSKDLWTVLSLSQEVSRASGGSFDVTVGPVVKLWRQARRSGQMPDEARLTESRAAVGYRKLVLDEALEAATLTAPGMRLDLGGIAKGYAADAALYVLRQHGVGSALIDAGGDVVIGDAPPDAEGWRIGIAPLEARDAPPSRYLIIANAAVATSGDAWQHVVIDGKRYSHIVDPKTGLGLTDHSSVTVITWGYDVLRVEGDVRVIPGTGSPMRTHNGAYADALASGVSVLGPQAGLALIERTPRTATIIVRKPGDQVQTFESKRIGELKIVPADELEEKAK